MDVDEVPRSALSTDELMPKSGTRMRPSSHLLSSSRNFFAGASSAPAKQFSSRLLRSRLANAAYGAVPVKQVWPSASVSSSPHSFHCEVWSFARLLLSIPTVQLCATLTPNPAPCSLPRPPAPLRGLTAPPCAQPSANCECFFIGLRRPKQLIEEHDKWLARSKSGPIDSRAKVPAHDCSSGTSRPQSSPKFGN
jgi:hypothetical protein